MIPECGVPNLLGGQKMMRAKTIFFSLFAIASIIVCMSGQNTTAEGSIYSPKGAYFTISVPGSVKPAKGGAFYGNRSVFRLIEPFKDAKVFYINVEKDGRRRVGLSFLQLTLDARQSSDFLTEKQIDVITTLIGDELEVSGVSKKTVDDTKWTSWDYHRGYSPTKRNPDGQVYALRKGNILILLEIEYDYASSTDREIEQMMASFSIRS